MKNHSLLKALLSASAILILGSITIAATTQYRGVIEGGVEVPGRLNGYLRIDGRPEPKFAKPDDR